MSDDRACGAPTRTDRDQEELASWRDWIDQIRSDGYLDDEGDLEIDDVLAAALFTPAHRIDRLAQKAKLQIDALRRRAERGEAALVKELEVAARAFAAANQQIETLEAAFAQAREREANAAAVAEPRKALAGVERSIAQDRSLRGLRDGQRAYPHAQKGDLARARLATNRAIGVDDG